MQTVWTLIRLLLEEQSDLGPHCLQKFSVYAVIAAAIVYFLYGHSKLSLHASTFLNFLVLGLLSSYMVCENRVALKALLGGVKTLYIFLILHEKTQSNRV